MNGSKMKQLLLRFLLVCNVILLAVIVVFGVRNTLRVREQNRQITERLKERGVTCGSSVYSALLEDKAAYTIYMDTEAQERFCKSFLTQSAEVEAQAGGSLLWSDAEGTIEWTSGGTVNGNVDWATVTIPDSREKAEKLIRKRMKAAGMDVGQTAFASVTSEDGFIVRVQEGIMGRNLQDCELKFELSKSGSLVISGKWCFGTPTRVVMDELDNSTPEDILMSLVNQNSDITQITRAKKVYVLSDKSGGRFSILPCWKIATDQGEFVLNSMTGLTAESAEDTAAEPLSNEPSTENSTQSELRPGTGGSTDADSQTDTDSNSDWITAQAEDEEESPDASAPTTDTAAESETDTPINSSPDDDAETSNSDPELPDEHGIYG